MALVAFTAVALLVPGFASAATLKVCPSGCQYTTIAAALNAASSGDTILVGPGSYAGGFTIDQSIALHGSGADLTRIVGGIPLGPGYGTSPVVSVAVGVSVSISAVTITGGVGANGEGIRNNGTLRLEHSVVRENQGAGISSSAFPQFGESPGTLTVQDSTVTGNGSGFLAGGIEDFGDGVIVLRNSSVTRNLGNGISVGEGDFIGGTLTLDHSTVNANSSNGIFVDLGGKLTVTTSTINGNNGSGILSADGRSLTIDGSTITGNRTSFSGGGIWTSNFFVFKPLPTTIKNSTISNNTAGTGGGLELDAGPATIESSTINGNRALRYGGGVFDVFSNLTIKNTTVAHNSAGIDGGGIFFQTGGNAQLQVLTSRIKDNTPNNCVEGVPGGTTTPC